MNDTSSGGSPPTRFEQRVPIETRVRLEFDRFQGFVEAYSSNISLGGMFIYSDEPQPPGTIVQFELTLAGDDYTLIRGRGEVAWVRSQDEGAGKPPGMGIRFRELDPTSEELIMRMVSTHLKEGGKAFELYPPTLGAEGLEREDAASAPEDQPASPKRKEALRVPDLDELFSDSQGGLGSPAADDKLTKMVERPPEAGDGPPAPAGSPPETEKERQAVTELRRFMESSKRRRRKRRVRVWGVAAVVLAAGAASAALLFWEPLQSALNGESTPVPTPTAEPPALAVADPPAVGWQPEEVPAAEPEPSPAMPSEAQREPDLAARQEVPAPELESVRPREPVPTRAATAVETIVWEESGGEFLLRLRGNGAIGPERIRRFRLDGDNPRELVQIQGIERPFEETALPVVSALVRQIRTGFHSRPTGPELHIVLDLVRADLPVPEVEQRGPETILRLAAN